MFNNTTAKVLEKAKRDIQGLVKGYKQEIKTLREHPQQAHMLPPPTRSARAVPAQTVRPTRGRQGQGEPTFEEQLHFTVGLYAVSMVAIGVVFVSYLMVKQLYTLFSPEYVEEDDDYDD